MILMVIETKGDCSIETGQGRKLVDLLPGLNGMSNAIISGEDSHYWQQELTCLAKVKHKLF